MPQKNLLNNASFETSLDHEWHLSLTRNSSVYCDSYHPFKGSRSIRIENHCPENRTYFISCNQTIPPPQNGMWFKISAAMRILNFTGRAGVGIKCFNANGVLLPMYNPDISCNTVNESRDWIILSHVFRIHEETDKISIGLYIKGQGTVWFDDVSVTIHDNYVVQQITPSKGAFKVYDSEHIIWFDYGENKIFRNTSLPIGPTRDTIKISGARNELECFQVIICPGGDIKQWSIEFSTLTKSNSCTIINKKHLSFYQIAYVNLSLLVLQNSRYGENPDILFEGSKNKLTAAVNNPVLIKIYIPPTTEKGIYYGTITIKIGESSVIRIPIEVNVWDFTLPNNSHFFVRSNFWLDLIRKYDSRGDKQILDDYYSNLRQHHVNSLREIELVSKLTSKGLSCDFSMFDRQVTNLFDEFGFETITIGPMIGDASGWQYRRPWMSLDPESPRFYDLYGEYCENLEEHLRNKGWLDRCWIQYWDEPQVDDPGFENILKIGMSIKKSAPDLKVFMTSRPISCMYDIVDIWCVPFYCNYFFPYDIQKQKILGNKIFVYHNDPYIATPLIDKRLYAWRYKLAGIDGVYAWWNLAFWQNNPYYNPSQTEIKGQTHNIMIPGDGVLLYPNPDGAGPPVNSLRWEIFRQGLEDYEYFWLLEQAIQSSMKKLNLTKEFSDYANYRINEYLNMVISNYFDAWNRDVKYLYTLRTRIAEEIQTTEQSPIVLVKTQPQEGHLEPTQIINITGLTKQGTKVLINNNPVLVNDDGSFNTHIKNPSDGIVVIKVKHGWKEKIIKRQF